MVDGTIPHRRDIARLRSKLIRWFNTHGRTFPWRQTHDPFKVLIAEIMLRRTKADQVAPVYKRLLCEYPNVQSLARARPSKVERLVSPLGLKWRAPTFRLLAKELIRKHHGRVPSHRHELAALPGVGQYVAGAVLCLAYRKREWIVDSNIVRLFRRFFGMQTSKEGRRDKHVVETAKTYICRTRDPKKANLALLDFTAVVCRPTRPNCSECPLKNLCASPDPSPACLLIP